jgi:hypothetical protein
MLLIEVCTYFVSLILPNPRTASKYARTHRKLIELIRSCSIIICAEKAPK